MMEHTHKMGRMEHTLDLVEDEIDNKSANNWESAYHFLHDDSGTILPFCLDTPLIDG